MAFHPLSGSATRADLIAAVGEALDRHHIVQLEIVAGEGRHIGRRRGLSLSLSHGVIAQITINVKAGTAQAGSALSSGITLPMDHRDNCSLQRGNLHPRWQTHLHPHS